MKKVAIYTVLILIAGVFGACHKYTSVEGGYLPADFTAQVNGSTWDAADSTQFAAIANGTITLIGTSSSGEQLTIVLNDTVVGTYLLNQQTASVATFGVVDSASLTNYSTSQGVDTAQAGGSVTVMSIDPVGKTISGIFSFKTYRQSDASELLFTSGVFYRIPYGDSLPVPNTGDTLTATVNGTNWTGTGITAEALGGELAITGALPDGSNAMTLLLPVTSTPGSYSLADISLADCQGAWNPTPSPSFISTSGTLNVIQNDIPNSRISGNFVFTATNPIATGGPFNITNGYFSVYYGQ